MGLGGGEGVRRAGVGDGDGVPLEMKKSERAEDCGGDRGSETDLESVGIRSDSRYGRVTLR